MKNTCYNESVLKETLTSKNPMKGGDKMNTNDLKAEIARNNLTVPKLAELMGIDKKTLYSRISGETAFKQTEIAQISQILKLTEDAIIRIFFADVVS